MAVRIRLQRMGAKGRPFFRIVVADSRGKRDGAFLENIGYFDPVAEPAKIELKVDRAVAWLDKGAIPSESVRNILHKKNVLGAPQSEAE
ncbi:30S ribosomal protein S16 [bacterium]|nr:30S ribosomal protein S16 [bacterium]